MSRQEEALELRDIKPYCVVFHDPTGQAACYDRHYRLISETASSELVTLARAHGVTVQHGFGLSGPEQRPAWLTPDMDADCVTVFLFKDPTVAYLDLLRRLPYF